MSRFRGRQLTRADVAPGKDPWPKSTLPVDEPEWVEVDEAGEPKAPLKRRRTKARIVKRVKPQPLVLAWVGGGGWGERPQLLGTVPVGTVGRDVEYGTEVIHRDLVTVGTLEEFIALWMNPGSDD